MSSDKAAVTSLTAAIPGGGNPGVAAFLKRITPPWLRRDHIGFYALAIAGMVALMPRFLLLGEWAIERLVLRLDVARPDLQAWPYVPSIILPLAVVALCVFSASHQVRVAALLVSAVPLGFVYRYIDWQSVVAFTALAVVAFGVVRLPIGRAAAAALMMALSFGALALSSAIGGSTELAGVIAFQATLLPMLWYSVYEHMGPRGPLPFQRFFLYLSVRFFGGPVVTYPDLFSTSSHEQLAETRLAGVRAIYIALIAAITTAAAGWVDRVYPEQALTGIPLLAASYVGYVGAYCKIVVAFNLFIGLLRLFGIPVRSNFNYWLLAPTPNEHWKRWNILFREWVVTFVFFPIMRAKRWLFVAVMASLMTSALLHIVPVMAYEDPSEAYIAAQTLYWFLNGVAIYVVLIVPQRWPGVVRALRMRESRVWFAVGVVLTSAFYAVLYGIRDNARDWGSLLHYLARLTTLT